jgi:hypothetical protein
MHALLPVVGDAEKEDGRPAVRFGWEPTVAEDMNTRQRATLVCNAWDVDGVLILPLTCREDTMGHLGFEWCHQACQRPRHVSERHTRQRVHSGPNPCLGVCAAHLVDPCAQLPPQHMPAHPRWIRVAGCPRQLVRPWSPGSRSRHRTNVRWQGEGWRAQMSRLSWKNLQLSFCSLGAAETRGRLEPNSRIRSDARGQKHSSR